MAIAIRITNPLKPSLPIDPSLDSLAFEHPPSSGLASVAISFQADGAAMTTSAVLEDGDIAASLQRLEPDSQDPEYVNQQLQGAFAALHTISRRILELVIQELQLRERPRRFAGSHAWALSGGPWKDLPQRILMTGVQLLSAYRLDAAWKQHLQHLINLGEHPLTATLHLQEAQADRGTRFRWIQATTAAELAIKEALLRLEPRLSPLM